MMTGPIDPYNIQVPPTIGDPASIQIPPTIGDPASIQIPPNIGDPNSIQIPPSAIHSKPVPAPPPPPLPNPVRNYPLDGGDPTVTGQHDTAPPVPGGDAHPGKGVSVINTQAMRTFADNMGQWTQPLKLSQSAVLGVNARPGTFPTAMQLASQVNDPSSGLSVDVHTSLGNMVEAVEELVDAMHRVASRYDTAEEANHMKAEDFRTAMAGVAGPISDLAPPSAPPGGAPDPAGGGGSGTGKS
jgi:hypothetical protein